MERLLIKPVDIALILNDLNLPESETADLLNNIWSSERAFLSNGYSVTFKEWIHAIQLCSDYIHDKETIGHEIHAIQNDIAPQGGKIDAGDYVLDDLDHGIFFKSLRIRLLYIDKNGFERMKFSRLVNEYSFSIYAIKNYIMDCLLFYHMEMRLQGNETCDIEDIGLDDIVTFRLVGSNSKAQTSAEIVDETKVNPELSEDYDDIAAYRLE